LGAKDEDEVALSRHTEFHDSINDAFATITAENFEPQSNITLSNNPKIDIYKILGKIQK
jgi:hypothetical protein